MLYDEARYLYFSIFRRAPSDDLFEAYVRAHSEISDLRVFDERQLKTVQAVVVHSLDAVGIEPWFRGKKIRHALSTKMLLLAYLAECDACHLEFSRCGSNDRMALLHMGCAALKAGFCLLRGRIQKAWYELV
jgi:hypothetical protein